MYMRHNNNVSKSSLVVKSYTYYTYICTYVCYLNLYNFCGYFLFKYNIIYHNGLVFKYIMFNIFLVRLKAIQASYIYFLNNIFYMRNLSFHFYIFLYIKLSVFM